MPYVLHQVDGANNGLVRIPPSYELDRSHSQVLLDTCFVQFQNGQQVAPKSSTDDKIVTGYTSEFVPFLVIVDGFYGGETADTYYFIDEHVTPSIEYYVRELKKATQKGEQGEVTELIIKKIFELRQQAAPNATFTMTLAVSYQVGDKTFCSGFGIGDTALALKRTNGSYEQLVASSKTNGVKDAFDTVSYQNMEAVIGRNTVFTTEVHPGDELVGYTYVYHELQKKTAAVELSGNPTVDRFSLNTDSFEPGQSLI